MKPKNRLQKTIVSLSSKLPCVSRADKQWAEQECFDKYYVQVRNRNYCLECGHKFMPSYSDLAQRVLPVQCPECNTTNLVHVNYWDAIEHIYEYWAVLTTIKGFQVVRIIRSIKTLKRKRPAEYSHTEVMQHWIREDGKMVTLSVLAQGLSAYYDSWVSGTPLEPRTKSYGHKLRQQINPEKIARYPGILSVIRRNGYNGDYHGLSPQKFFQGILAYPHAETLLKAGQIELFCGYLLGKKDQVDTYWQSVKIALRNNYRIDEPSLWLDHIRLIDILGKDLSNSKYVCPKDLAKDHQYYVEKVNKINRKLELAKKMQQIQEAEQEYHRQKHKFFDLEFSYDNIMIVPLKSVLQFAEQGEQLHHCLFASGYHEKEHSLILAAYVNGELTEHVEVNLENFTVSQSRGLQNKITEHHDRIVAMVWHHMREIVRATEAGYDDVVKSIKEKQVA